MGNGDGVSGAGGGGKGLSDESIVADTDGEEMGNNACGTTMGVGDGLIVAG